MVGRDNARASRIAETVLARGPRDAAVEAAALMVAADARRRGGDLAAAERLYRRAERHPGGGGFREEAMLRRASLLGRRGRTERALDVLREAAGRYRDGALAPERAALAVTLYLERGAAQAAAAALESVADHPDGVLDRSRLRVAEALLQTEPRRAARLLRAVAGRGGAIGGAAKAILRRAETTGKIDED